MKENVTTFPSGTVTFLFTAIEGSTKLAQQSPDAMLVLLARHQEILKQTIQTHNGCVFQIVDDPFFALSGAKTAGNSAAYLQYRVGVKCVAIFYSSTRCDTEGLFATAHLNFAIADVTAHWNEYRRRYEQWLQPQIYASVIA
jgi:class 3 adenylate cyclase